MTEWPPKDKYYVGFKFTSEELASKTWRFETLGTGTKSPHCTFLSSGYVGGIQNDGSCRWELVDNIVTFINEDGRRTALFDRMLADDTGKLIMQGSSLLETGVTHVLYERDPISNLAEDTGEVRLMSKGLRRLRRNLVVVRANENSMHPSWPIDIPEEDRTWDLCTSFYGHESSFPPKDFAEYHVLQNMDQKWPAIHKLFHKASPLWEYDYFLFPDDDIETSWSTINRIFEVSRRQALHLAQPALAECSYFSHKITLRNDLFRLRFTNFVEVMVPLFSRFAMNVCVPTFAMSQSGWGLDYVWPHQLGNQTASMGIIDETPVLHGRPVGQSYDMEAAHAEMLQLMADYGARIDSSEFGGLKTCTSSRPLKDDFVSLANSGFLLEPDFNRRGFRYALKMFAQRARKFF